MAELKLTVSLIGPPAVGKSSIISSATSGYIRDKHFPTLFESSQTKPWYGPDGQFYTTCVQDVGGYGFSKDSFHYNPSLDQSWKNTDGIMLVFSIDSLDSFNDVKFLYHELIEKDEKLKTKKVFLIACKYDLASNRKVASEEIDKFTDETKIQYFSVSPLNNINTVEVFGKVWSSLYTAPAPVLTEKEKKKEKEKPIVSPIEIPTDQPKKNKSLWGKLTPRKTTSNNSPRQQDPTSSDPETPREKSDQKSPRNKKEATPTKKVKKDKS